MIPCRNCIENTGYKGSDVQRTHSCRDLLMPLNLNKKLGMTLVLG